MHNRDRVWRTADGRGIAVKDMTDSHLVNVLNWIIDNPVSYPRSVYDLMLAETKFRQTPLFAEGKPYPQQNGKRWQLIDPKTGEGKITPPPKEYVQAVQDNAAYQAMSKRTQEKRKKERA